jgi:PKD repeat protein
MPDGSIILMGGSGGPSYFNDTWRSTDNGATWTLMSANALWMRRSGHSSVAMPDGSIVLMGGFTFPGLGIMNDTCRSTDNGTTWTQLAASAGWRSREDHTSVVMPDGSIVLMGGIDASTGTSLNDTWRSTDNGTTWSQMSASSGWGARYDHTSVVMPDGSIVLMGGSVYPAVYGNDTWRSIDNGTTWTLMNASSGWAGRVWPESVAMPDGSIVLMGGWDGSGPSFNDTWRSTDNGATWIQLAQSAGWTARNGHTSVCMPDGSIVLMGGSSGGIVNDTWRLNPIGSSAQNPSHSYTAPGKYQVALQVYDSSGYNSIRKVGYINASDWAIILKGVRNESLTRFDFEGLSAGNRLNYTDFSGNWSGYALWRLIARIDDNDVTAFNDTLADIGYNVTVRAGDLYNKTFNSSLVKRNDSWIVADTLDGNPFPTGVFPWPLRLRGSGPVGADSVGNITMIELEDLALVHADYYVNVTNGTVPLAVEFTDISTGHDPTITWWDFGDGTTEGNLSSVVVHTYTSQGTFNPVIHVSNTINSDYKNNATITADVPPLPPGLNTAVQTVVNDPTIVPNGDLSQTGLSNSPQQQTTGSTIDLLGGRDPISLPTTGYVILVDTGARANGDHPVKYVQVDAVTNQTTVFDAEALSSNIDFTPVAGNISDPGGDPGSIGDPNAAGSPSPNPGGGLGVLTLVPACAGPDCSHSYALLIDGGINKTQNHIRYWNDISFMYQLLNKTYGYPKNHITVLMSDGTSPGTDRHNATKADGTLMNDSSPLDFDLDGTTDVLTLSATKTNLTSTLNGFNSKTPSANNLFIFTTGHGGNDTRYYNGRNSSLLYLWGNNEYINDTEFVRNLPTAPLNITIVMEQCNSGGFVDNFTTQYSGTQKRVIATAANGSEPSWGNGYSNAWMAGVARYDIGAAIPGADSSRDGLISMLEAHTFATNKDPAALSTLPTHEHPQYGDKAAGAGSTRYLSTCSVPSITVTSPNGGEIWCKGYNRNITWVATGLSGKNVVIELWNNSGSSKKVTIATVAASNQTYKWSVDNTTKVVAGSDYYIQISNSTQSVTDRGNGVFKIYNYTKRGYIKINTTPIPNLTQAGASIYLDGWLQPAPPTNRSLPADPGSHYVGVTRSGFNEPTAQFVIVPNGTGTQSVSALFGLVEGGFSNDPNDPDYQPPAGKLVITSTPVIGRIVMGGEATDLMTNTGEIGIDPGTYEMTVMAQGYRKPAVQTVVIGPAQTVHVSFSLTQKEPSRAVFRGATSGENWFFDSNMDGAAERHDRFGQVGDLPLVDDFNNDGIMDRAVFRGLAKGNNWLYDYNMDSSTPDYADKFGQVGDLPLVGDFNNVGITDRAVFRSVTSGNNWFFDYNMNGGIDKQNKYGLIGDIPLVGYFNNDGIMDRAVFRGLARGNNWLFDYHMDSATPDNSNKFGQVGDLPLIWFA